MNPKNLINSKIPINSKNPRNPINFKIKILPIDDV
jgi:hypothetical protein